MKPDWKDAPEWAQWLGRDASGQWWWYERKPFPTSTHFSNEGGDFALAHNPKKKKAKSLKLECRP